MKLSSLESDTELTQEIGRRMARMRLESNLSQEELAEVAGVSRSAIVNIERGGASRMPIFLRVLRALGQLDEFESAVPELLPSPIEMLELRGHERKRATGKRSSKPRKTSAEWTWGESTWE
jgi:transcriptional regulator with XRE-family HTH domain